MIENLRIAAPCPASWEGMAGDERVRHCSLCSLNVYNFAEMTDGEVRQLLERTEGRVCARLYRRADGTVLTRDCPTGLRALRRRASRAATALIAALLSLPGFAKPRLKTHGSKVKIEIQRVGTQQAAVLTGVVRDQAGNKLPGVTVSVRDEVSNQQRTAVTDVNGAFGIASLNDGLYRVEVTLPGLEPATVEHLSLKASEVTHASVVLRWDTITVGVLTLAVPMSDGNTTTVSRELMQKLPF